MDRRRVTLFWCSCCRCLAGAAVVLLLRKRTRTRDFHGDVGRRRICPSVLSPKKGFPLCCEVHTCGTESPPTSIRPFVRPFPLYHLPPSSTPSNTYGLHEGQREGASSCSLRNDREDQHSSTSPPRIFLSFSTNDHFRGKGGELH